MATDDGSAGVRRTRDAGHHAASETRVESERDTATAVCENCRTPLTGAFCAACGQSRRSPIVTLPAFASHVMGELARLDSRLIRSVGALLFRPGHLTREYLDGRRVRYTQPVQLYLAAAAIFFLMNVYRPFIWIDTERLRVVGELPGMIISSEVVRARLLAFPSDATTYELFSVRFAGAVNGFLPVLLIGSVVLFSGILHLTNRRQEPRFLPHAVFALHWIAFFLLVTAVARLFPTAWSLPSLSLVPAFAYLVLALRRTYGQRLAPSVAKAVLLLVAFLLILAAWLQSAIAIGNRAV
jgi:hypothetical protein